MQGKSSIKILNVGVGTGFTSELLQEFGKKHEHLEVKALSLGGTLLDKSQLAVVASLPNKEEAITRLALTLQAPITKFVRTVAEPHSKLVRLLAAIKDKKQAES